MVKESVGFASVETALGTPVSTTAKKSSAAVKVVGFVRTLGGSHQPSKKQDYHHTLDVPPYQAAQAPWIQSLYAMEIAILVTIQRAICTPLTYFSVAMHHSTRKLVVIPAVALLTWTYSLPNGVSLVIFICVSNSMNGVMKWFVQRPRPPWTNPPNAKHRVINVGGAWEEDYSFPSGHTQFTTGLAVVMWWEYALPDW